MKPGFLFRFGWIALGGIQAVGGGVALGQTAAPTVEFILFSGRDRPKAVLTQTLDAQATRDSVQARETATFPCADLPDMGSTPLYNGVLVSFPEPVLQRKTMVVQKGFIHYDDGKPCYRDTHSRLEALLVGMAFGYDDMNAPQGPRPMNYLACMVPDTLHPDIAPCETARLAPRQKAMRAVGMGQAPWDFAGFGQDHSRRFSPTGRRIGVGSAPLFGKGAPPLGVFPER